MITCSAAASAERIHYRLPVLADPAVRPGGRPVRRPRYKRRILYVTQALSGLLGAVFALLTAAHVIQIWSAWTLKLL
jgi:hypothetical protein